MKDMTASQKGTFAYRVVAGALLAVATYIGGKVLGYSERSDQKMNSVNKTIMGIDRDVSQIKWELPLIKSTMAEDKKAVQLQIANEKSALQSQISDLQSRINIALSEGRESGEKISDLRHELAMLKQKISTE